MTQKQIGKEEVVALSANRLVPYYLMASYLYYGRDESLMTDEAYDHCCLRLDAEWDAVTHPHRKLIERGALSATTGFTLRYNRWPRIILVAAHDLLRSLQESQ